MWSLMERTDEPEVRELMIREAMHCPAGRLVLHDKKAHREIEHCLPAQSVWWKIRPWDAAGLSGCVGGITVESHDSKPYEKRNHVTLRLRRRDDGRTRKGLVRGTGKYALAELFLRHRVRLYRSAQSFTTNGHPGIQGPES
jgi:hypothetical protein